MADETASAASSIFLSYRRDDSEGHVLALHQKLIDHFGDCIFMDADSIAPGQDFVSVIDSKLRTCSVMLAVIGRDWLTASDAKANRRLDNPGDYVRLEISTALKNRQVLVIPVLVQGARMPGAAELPEELTALSRRNAIELSGGARFNGDVQRLITAIEASGITAAPKWMRAPEPPTSDSASASEEPDIEEDDPFEVRRRREIAEHLRTARLAFDDGDYQAVLHACDKAIYRDPKAADARALKLKARTALDDLKIGKWLTQAQETLNREALSEADLATASDLVDHALALSPTHESAVKLRQDLLLLRRRRDRQREMDRQVQAVVALAKKCFDNGDYDEAIAHCDDALASPGASTEARDLRAKAIEAREEDRRERDHSRRRPLSTSTPCRF